MFIKATGPICLSESSDDSDSDMDVADLQLIGDKELNPSEIAGDETSDSDDSDDEVPTHPNKKKKLT